MPTIYIVLTKMGLHKVLFSLSFCVLCLAIMAHVGYAQDTPQDYLNAHNAARSQVSVPPLTWDNTIAAFAQNYANNRKGDCQLVHSGGGDRHYGENLAGSTGDLSGADAVRLWVNEKPNYDHNSNKCVGGECGHYTQVVWKNSVRVGCAKVRCANGGTFVGCNYDPAGNVIGQKPY